MNKLFLSATIAALVGVAVSKTMTMSLSTTDINKDGWVTLFDGKSISKWHTYNKATTGKIWKVENGAIHLDAALKKSSPEEGGDLITNDEYENFHLKMEWKVSPKGNSGIIFFINEDKKYANTYETGLEMQVLDNGSATTLGHPDGKLYTHRAGDLYDLLAAKEVTKPTGQWNAVEIVVNKGKLDFYMNGQHTVSTNLWNDNWKKMVAISKFKDMPGYGTYKKGRIALQDHGDEVWYRNVMIKRLTPQ